MFTTILCATDGSDHAGKAVAVAADLGRRYNARVIVLTAYDAIPKELGTPYLEDLTARRVESAEELMKAAVAMMNREITMRSHRRVRATSKMARAGARGLGPLGAMLLGSVSTRVVHEAPCPVLLTR